MAEVECVIYARLSQDQQHTGAGVERQLEECRDYADQLGWVVLDEYVDNDMSATKGKRRPNFERLLSEVHSPVVVVCWHTDRLVRMVKDLERVIDQGLFVYAKHAGHIDLATPAGRATARTITAWATYEGEQKAERQKSAHRQRAKAGRPFWNRRPFGFNADGTPHEIEAPAVRELYRKVLVDPNLSALARDLNDRGFVTSAGGAWRGTGVRALLMGARNAGIATYHGNEVGSGTWQALVDEETYRAATRSLDSGDRFTGGRRLGQSGRIYLLTGFAACATCEQTVRIAWRGGRQFGYRVYQCPLGHGSAIGEWADAWVGNFVIEKFRRDPDALDRLHEIDAPDTEDVHAEIERLVRKGEGYAKALDSDAMDLNQFTALNKSNLLKIQELRKSAAKIGLSTVLRGLVDVEDLEHHWNRVLPIAEQHAVMVELVDRIVVHSRTRGRTRGMSEGDVEFWIRGEDEPRH